MSSTTRGADKIVESISSQLASGVLKKGDRLPAEAKLCEEHNVSRTVVREAIQQLKAIGVLRTITGSGSYITEGDLSGLKNSLQFFATMTGDTDSWVELLEMRIIIESDCARNLAGHKFTKRGLNKIKAALQQMEDNKHDLIAFSEFDVKFHQAIISAAGNQLYSAILSSLSNLQLKFSKDTYRVQNSQQLVERNFNEHTKIVEAIEQRDPDLAEQAMKQHLNATMQNLIHYIDNHN